MAEMKKGNIPAVKFLKNFSAVLDKFADPAAQEAIKKNRASMERLKNTFNTFVYGVHRSGFGDVMRAVYESLENLLVAAEPLANFLSTAFKSAFLIATAPVRLLVAGLADLAEYLGADVQSDISKYTAKILGIVGGLFALRKGYKLVRGLFGSGTSLSRPFVLMRSVLGTVRNMLSGMPGLVRGFIRALGPLGAIFAGMALAVDKIKPLMEDYQDKVKSSEDLSKAVKEDPNVNLNAVPEGVLHNIFNAGAGGGMSTMMPTQVNIKVIPDGTKFGDAVKAEVESSNQSVIDDIRSNTGR